MKRIVILTFVLFFPSAQADKAEECAHIRSEIARLHAYAANPPIPPKRPNSGQFQTFDIEPIIRRNIEVEAARQVASLESRASEIGCYNAFSDRPAEPTGMSFDQCFSKCKELTQRNDTECFDACRK